MQLCDLMKLFFSSTLDPIAKDILKKIKDKGCSEPDVMCRDCCGSEEDALYWAYYNDERKTAHICANKFRPPNFGSYQLRQFIIHELIHGLDHCKGTEFKDCKQRACSEIRAILYSGQCSQRTGFLPGGVYRLPGESLRQCVERNAIVTTQYGKGCKAQDVKDKMADCFKPGAEL